MAQFRQLLTRQGVKDDGLAVIAQARQMLAAQGLGGSQVVLVNLARALISGRLPERHVVFAYLRNAVRNLLQHTVPTVRWSPMVKQLARFTSLHHSGSAGFTALRGPSDAGGGCQLPQLLACAGCAWQLARPASCWRGCISMAASSHPSASPSSDAAEQVGDASCELDVNSFNLLLSHLDSTADFALKQRRQRVGLGVYLQQLANVPPTKWMPGGR